MCHAFSSNKQIDAMELELEDALNHVVGKGSGTFICCIVGKLAYFEGESPGERYVCRR
jgi:hypothetical protein